MVDRLSHEGQEDTVAGGGDDTKKVRMDDIKRRVQKIDEGEELQTMRDRLYSRTEPPVAQRRHGLSNSELERTQRIAAITKVQKETHRIDEEIEAPKATPLQSYSTHVVPPQPMRHPQKLVLHGYRKKALAIGVVFFLVALVLSSAALFFGQNTISGNNITIDVESPFAIGGGDEIAVQVAVTNHNAVAVESATLIVEYPPGTQEVEGEGKELFRQRVPIGNIKPGEVVNIPTKAKIFGEENEEKTIAISVEYRVEGSNATFFKEAEPVVVKISSSPVVLSIESIKEVSSGQEVTLTLSLASNSSSEIEDLLVQADYPLGFDFTESTPKPVKGQNLWRIESFKPEAKETITIKGAMLGGSTEERAFKFSVGVPSERDRFSLASIFTTASTDIKITNPFAGLTVETNGKIDKTVSVGPQDTVTVHIAFKNTLQDTIYDGVVIATLSGNGLNADNVSAGQGFFDSSKSTVMWDRSHLSGLGELAPGDEEKMSFTIRGANLDTTRTPQISYTVSVSGRRVSETQVPQKLTDIESRTIRFQTTTSLSSHGVYSTGPFTNTGPMPPKAEATTQYTIMLGAKNGSNELTDAVVTMTLPSYVSWTGAVSGGDNVTYNPSSREVTWRIGNVDANASVDAAFQLAFLPSVSQVGTVPSLVGEQYLRATDRFTGTVVRATAAGLSTRLPEDPNPDAQTGRVEPK